MWLVGIDRTPLIAKMTRQRDFVVTITIELPDNLEVALKAQANAQGVSEVG
jgi:hypothetical protein